MPTRLIRPGDAPALAAVLRANRDFLAPWDPIRDEDYFTEAGQHDGIVAALRGHAEGTKLPLTRNGFVRFGTAPQYLKIAGEWQDHAMFQLLAPDRNSPRHKKGARPRCGRAHRISGLSEAYTQFTGSPVTGLHRDLTSSSVCLRVVVGLRPTHSCSG